MKSAGDNSVSRRVTSTESSLKNRIGSRRSAKHKSYCKSSRRSSPIKRDKPWSHKRKIITWSQPSTLTGKFSCRRSMIWKPNWPTESEKYKAWSKRSIFSCKMSSLRRTNWTSITERSQLWEEMLSTNKYSLKTCKMRIERCSSTSILSNKSWIWKRKALFWPRGSSEVWLKTTRGSTGCTRLSRRRPSMVLRSLRKVTIQVFLNRYQLANIKRATNLSETMLKFHKTQSRLFQEIKPKICGRS